MPFYKVGLAKDPMIKPPLWKCINKSENHIWKRLHLKYMLEVQIVTKSF